MAQVKHMVTHRQSGDNNQLKQQVIDIPVRSHPTAIEPL